MIFDSIENLEKYRGFHSGLDKAFDYMQENDLSALEQGMHEIEGRDIFVISALAEGKAVADGKLEAHKEYIDIQICLAGVDQIGWRPVSECKEIDTPYDADRDIMFFKERPDTLLNVRSGLFAVFFPEDAHAPEVGEGQLHKIIFKVKA
ncbi:MAG: YhcH/YjgK/YiaL family protein [Lentisphaeraceae bacterium]|nr:YhcH/YjgK/YiaL family protein [Lentisphaeraceae bacterium]